MAIINTIRSFAVAFIFALVELATEAKTVSSEVFDTVIESGRVMD